MSTTQAEAIRYILDHANRGLDSGGNIYLQLNLIKTKAMEALKGPTIYVATNSRDGEVKVHVPRSLGAKVEFLECDEPDWPGLKARGIPHPLEESAALERNPAYETHTENL